MNSAEHLNNPVKESKEVDMTRPPGDSNSLLKEQKDVLLGMYCESCTHARHYENQRATISNIIMLATVGLIGYIGHLDHEDWVLTLAIMLLGVFGTAFTALYFKRISRYEERADKFRSALDALLFRRQESEEDSTTLTRIQTWADRDTAKKFQKLHKLRAVSLFRMFWPLLIAFIAFGFTVYAWRTPKTPDKSPPLTINCTDGAAVNVSQQK